MCIYLSIYTHTCIYLDTHACIHIHVCLLSHSLVSNSLQPSELWPTRLLCPFDFPCKNTGVGYHSLLQGIFPAQGWNLHLLFLNWQVDSLPLSHLGSLYIYTLVHYLSIALRVWEKITCGRTSLLKEKCPFSLA